jgi:thiol reductant ABC exporter CydC subunit
MKIYWAIILTAATMLSAVGLVSTGAWLISSAALMPPILVLQVAIVAVRFFGISRGVFRWSERVVSHDVALSGTTQLRVDLWKVAAKLGPLGVWRLRSSDALDRLTSDTDTLQDEVTRVRVPLFAAALSAVLLSLLQFLLLPLAGIVFAISFIVSGILIPKLITRIEIKIARAAISVRNQISADVFQAITNSNRLRILNLTDSHIAKIIENEKLRVGIESRASVWAGVSSALNGISSAGAVFVSLIAGVVAYNQGGLSGQMIAVVTLLPWASAEIVGTFSLSATARTRTTLANERISEFLHKSNPLEIDETKTLKQPNEMVLQDVAVGWNGETIVSHLNFAVSRGEIIGIVGPSGSGKSTVASAILRLIPHQGKISLDGVSIKQISDYQHHVTALLQTTYIFHTNVRENLRIANNAKTDADLLKVLTQVGLNNWFEKLEDGFDSMIGDSDRGLSGGEIQRIGIARTILSGASFILLDEPTEHLDSETAGEIWEMIQRVFADKTVIVITHDLRITDNLRKTVSLV